MGLPQMTNVDITHRKNDTNTTFFSEIHLILSKNNNSKLAVAVGTIPK